VRLAGYAARMGTLEIYKKFVGRPEVEDIFGTPKCS